MTKSDNQIQNDKAAVAKMVGARSAMSSAINRIELLEASLKRELDEIASLQRSIGTDILVMSYDCSAGKSVAKRAYDLFEARITSIKSVL
jgi:hypothetical protein